MIVTEHFVQRVKERAMNHRKIWAAISKLEQKQLPKGNWFVRVKHFVICGDFNTARTVKYANSLSIRGVEVKL